MSKDFNKQVEEWYQMEDSRKLQNYSNLCATYGDIRIRIMQIKEVLMDLEYKSQELENALIKQRSELKIEGAE